MNYRELQLRQLIKNNYVPKTLYQQETAELKEARAQDLIDQLQRDLGINFLLDYGEIIKELKGRTVRDILEEEKQLGEKNKDWEERFSELEELNNQQAQENKGEIKKLKDYNQAYLKKIGDLEKQLFSLAKEKIKGKKEALELVKQLEINWEQDKKQLIKKHEELIDNYHQQEQHLLRELEKKDQNYQQLAKNNQKLSKNLQTQKQEFNEQLRQINLLFDDKAKDYSFIDFNGLYKLLENIKAERERERERESKSKWWWQ